MDCYQALSYFPRQNRSPETIATGLMLKISGDRLKERLPPGLPPDWLIVMDSGADSEKIHLTQASRKVDIQN